MTLPTITDEQATLLLRTLRDSTFDWTVQQLPAVMDELGWVIAEEIPGKGSIADTPWGIPEADVALLYKEDTVQEMTIATGARATSTADNLHVVDTFAHLADLAQEIFGGPGERIPGKNPRLRWNTGVGTTTIQNVTHRVLIIWARPEFQKRADEIGFS